MGVSGPRCCGAADRMKEVGSGPAEGREAGSPIGTAQTRGVGRYFDSISLPSPRLASCAPSWSGATGLACSLAAHTHSTIRGLNSVFCGRREVRLWTPGGSLQEPPSQACGFRTSGSRCPLERHTHTQIGRLSHRSPHLLSLLTDQLAFDSKEENRHFFWTRFNHVCVKILES